MSEVKYWECPNCGNEFANDKGSDLFEELQAAKSEATELSNKYQASKFNLECEIMSHAATMNKLTLAVEALEYISRTVTGMEAPDTAREALAKIQGNPS